MRTKSKTGKHDDLRGNYDLHPMLRGGVMGACAARYRKGVNIVRLEPEVAKAFPSDASVNEVINLTENDRQISRNLTAKSHRI